MIYADNAATTKLDKDAFDAMKPFLLEQYGNASQSYSFSRSAKKAVKEARETIAYLIGAESEEIYFTSGGTESDNWAIKGSMNYRDKNPVITSEFEHHAVLNACKKIEALGYPVIYLHPSKNGFITPEILENSITDETKLVSIMTVNNEIGTIQPIKELSAIAHSHGALMHTDAVQALGHIDVNVEQLGVDLLSCSAHKFNGPKGIGFLYVRRGVPLSVYIDGGAQEFGMRAGTENVAAIAAMATALSKNTSHIALTHRHLRKLEKIIIGKLTAAGIDFIRNGDEPHNPGNLSLSFAGVSGEALMHRLDLMGIMVSTASACDSKNVQISHVLKAIETDEKYVLGTIRISLGVDNTTEEANKIAEALIKILSGQGWQKTVTEKTCVKSIKR